MKPEDETSPIFPYPCLSTLSRRQKALTHLNAHASTLGILMDDKWHRNPLKKEGKIRLAHEEEMSNLESLSFSLRICVTKCP